MDDYSVCRPFVPLRRYSVKDSGIRLNRYLFCDSRSCPNNQSCRNIQQGKTLRFRCPLTTAPVRSAGFFSYRTVVILHREQPHPRKPYRGIQRTSSKDSPARIFVVARQQRAVPLYAEKFFGIRKVLALRGWVAFPSHAT